MGSEWDKFTERTITSLKLHECIRRPFTDELDVITRLSNTEVSEKLQGWLRQLPNILPDGEALSNEQRTKGNEMFKGKSSNHLVLQAYNKAIFAAPSGSRALALGHANRAVVLIRLGRFREAYDDCQLALDGDYPDEMRLKVCFRQAECVENMNDPRKLGPIINGISKKVTDPSKSAWRKMQTLQAKYDAAEKHPVEDAALSDDNFLGDITIDSRIKEGRHVRTLRRFEADEIVVREKAISFVPVYDPNRRTCYDCQKCARVNVIPFPCPTCGSACYCSIQCRDDHRPVHRFECVGYQKRLWYFIGIAHLGIRCFLDGFDTIRSEILKLNDNTIPSFIELLNEVTSDGKEGFGNYRQMMGLVTNFEKKPIDDIIHYAMAAQMLAIYLFEFTPFISEYGLPHGKTACNLRNCCAALIMRHIGQLVCNGHAISELRAESTCSLNYGPQREAFVLLQEDSFLPQAGLLHLCFSSSRVFTAIYPQISMFNHNCQPNIRNHFNGSTLTVYTTRVIGRWSEIENCYGPHYKLMTGEKRLMYLQQQYCFECDCYRCRLKDVHDTYLREYNMVNCFEYCRGEFPMELTMEQLMAGIPCRHCKRTMKTDWYSNILGMDDDPEHLDIDIQTIVKEYARCERVLIGFNQTRADILEAILHQYTKHATRSSYLHSTLREYATELVIVKREQYGCMSLEFLTSCFYLLDLWAVLYQTNGNVPVELTNDEHTAVKEFRAAIDMVGEENRSLILEYVNQFVKHDKEIS